MNSEFIKQLEIYTNDLSETIIAAYEQKSEIENSDSKKREKKLEKLDKLIQQLEKMRKRVSYLFNYQEILDKLDELENLKFGDQKATAIKADIASILNNEDKDNLSLLKRKYDISEEDLKDLDAYKVKLTKRLNYLQRNIRLLKGEDLEKAEDEIEKINYQLEGISEYEDKFDDIHYIGENLMNFLKSKTDENRKKYLAETITATENKFNILFDEVLDDMEEFKNIKKKVDTKSENSKLSNWFKKNWKALTASIVTIATIASLVGYLSQIKKEIKSLKDNSEKDTTQSDNLTTPNDQTPEKPIETLDPTVEALITKGYSEYASVLMVQNFDKATIDSLLAIYRPEAEKYANCKDFNLDYLEDYENTTNLYVVTAEDAVDFVNRSYKIAATNFYEGASIDDIVKVVMSIDNKDLYKYDNGNLAQSFNTAFNPIVNNFLFNSPTTEDINKMDALQYFAKDGSDMDKFLTRFGSLAKNVLANPTQENQDKLFNFINIFALSFAGYSNVDLEKVLTNDKDYNEDAIVIDYIDWFVAYNSFIAPLYPLNTPIIPEEPVKPVITNGLSQTEIDRLNATYELELANYKLALIDYNAKFGKIHDVQVIINTALAGPEFESICGNQELTR